MDAPKTFDIEFASEADLPGLAALACELWPESDLQAEEEAFRNVLNSPDGALLVARAGAACAGFVHLTLRSDYVEGTTTSPVAYIEGLYVAPASRSNGVGRHLVQGAETWARSRGCTEIASDTEIENMGSIRFHKAVGFCEVNRVVCFTKKLGCPPDTS